MGAESLLVSFVVLDLILQFIHLICKEEHTFLSTVNLFVLLFNDAAKFLQVISHGLNILDVVGHLIDIVQWVIYMSEISWTSYKRL